MDLLGSVYPLSGLMITVIIPTACKLMSQNLLSEHLCKKPGSLFSLKELDYYQQNFAVVQEVEKSRIQVTLQ
jgi:hypothetical protein